MGQLGHGFFVDPNGIKAGKRRARFMGHWVDLTELAPCVIVNLHHCIYIQYFYFYLFIQLITQMTQNLPFPYGRACVKRAKIVTQLITQLTQQKYNLTHNCEVM